MTAIGRTPKKSLAPPRLPSQFVTAEFPRDDLADEAVLSRLAYTNVDLRGRSARLVDVDECRLTGCALTGSHVDKLTLSDAIVERCDLANVELSHCSFSRVRLSGCRLTGLTAPGAVWRHVSVTDCLADLSAFRFASFTRVEFTNCRLQAADFTEGDIRGSVFRRCDLTRAEFSQVKASGATFIDCTWEGIRGVASLAGSTIVNGSPIDALIFTGALAQSLQITLGHPDDFAED